MGVFYFLNGDYDAAIGFYKKAISLNKSEEILYENLGLVYERKEMPEEALNTYKEALKIMPASESMNSKAGELCYKRSEYEAAIEYIKKAIEANPKNAVYYDNLSLAYRSMNNYELAKKTLEKCRKPKKRILRRQQ